MHNFAQGLEYQQLCLERLEREQQPRDSFFTVEVYTGIGLAYAQMDKFDEAIQAFQQAISLVEELTTTDQLASMYGDVALHFARAKDYYRSEEHTSELQSHSDLVCRLLLEKKKTSLHT